MNNKVTANVETTTTVKGFTVEMTVEETKFVRDLLGLTHQDAPCGSLYRALSDALRGSGVEDRWTDRTPFFAETSGGAGRLGIIKVATL